MSSVLKKRSLFKEKKLEHKKLTRIKEQALIDIIIIQLEKVIHSRLFPKAKFDSFWLGDIIKQVRADVNKSLIQYHLNMQINVGRATSTLANGRIKSGKSIRIYYARKESNFKRMLKQHIIQPQNIFNPMLKKLVSELGKLNQKSSCADLLRDIVMWDKTFQDDFSELNLSLHCAADKRKYDQLMLKNWQFDRSSVSNLLKINAGNNPILKVSANKISHIGLNNGYYELHQALEAVILANNSTMCKKFKDPFLNVQLRELSMQFEVKSRQVFQFYQLQLMVFALKDIAKFSSSTILVDNFICRVSKVSMHDYQALVNLSKALISKVNRDQLENDLNTVCSQFDKLAKNNFESPANSSSVCNYN